MILNKWYVTVKVQLWIGSIRGTSELIRTVINSNWSDLGTILETFHACLLPGLTALFGMNKVSLRCWSSRPDTFIFRRNFKPWLNFPSLVLTSLDWFTGTPIIQRSSKVSENGRPYAPRPISHAGLIPSPSCCRYVSSGASCHTTSYRRCGHGIIVPCIPDLWPQCTSFTQ